MSETEKLKEWLKEQLWIPCCHVTGTHNPVHFEERNYICDIQLAGAFIRFCKMFGIDPVVKSDIKNCYWCQDYPEKRETGEGLKLSEGRHEFKEKEGKSK